MPHLSFDTSSDPPLSSYFRTLLLNSSPSYPAPPSHDRRLSDPAALFMGYRLRNFSVGIYSVQEIVWIYFAPTSFWNEIFFNLI